MSEKNRDYLKAREAAGKFVAVQVGDYINMHVGTFKSWYGTNSSNIDTLPKSGPIRVEILKINEDNKLVVKAGEATKEVDASLFYNYGKSFTG